LIDQADPPGHLPQQRQPAVAGEVPALGIGGQLLAVEAGKDNGQSVALCHREWPFLLGRGIAQIPLYQQKGPRAIGNWKKLMKYAG
jgi:hypothetical protein